MRIVFFGTDDISLPAFNALLASDEYEVVALVSQPDRQAGRGRKLKSPVIVELARAEGMDVIQKEHLKGKLTRQRINSYGQDINIVFAYGCYIPSVIFNTPEHRTINIHPSLLPRHRGANPIRASLMCGDKATGVSIQFVEKKMDTGDVLASQDVRISEDEIYTELSGRLSLLAADLLMVTLARIEAAEINPIPQDEGEACECSKWEKEDTIIDWSKPGVDIHNQIRAFSSSPGARTKFRTKWLQILRASFQPTYDTGDELPVTGSIGTLSKREFSINVHGGTIVVREVKPEGKKAMDACSFINGFRPEVGEKLG